MDSLRRPLQIRIETLSLQWHAGAAPTSLTRDVALSLLVLHLKPKVVQD
jgi:hypothetical protein